MNKHIFLIFILTLFLCVTSPSFCTEIRAYVHDLEITKNYLIYMGAQLKGEYAYIDYIYHPHHTAFNLNNEFVRLRAYKKTMWQQKLFVITHKVKSATTLTSTIIVHKEFDTLQNAQEFLAAEYTLAFHFFREGLEYQLNNAHLFLESIEGIPPSIEVIAPMKSLIYELFDVLDITDVITDSVPRLIEKTKNIKKGY